MGDDFLDLGDKGDKGDKKDDLILGKFKTPEDLAKAYTELEGKLGTLGTENATTKQTVADLERKIQEILAKPVEKPEEDDEQAYFINPKTAVEKAINKANKPLIRANFETAKMIFASTHPDFNKYEAKINEAIKMNPALMLQPATIGQLYLAVKGMEFDPAAFEKELREKLKKEAQDKVDGGLAEGDAGGLPDGGSKKVTLTEEEKKIARKFNPGLTVGKAYERAIALKIKHGGGR